MKTSTCVTGANRKPAGRALVQAPLRGPSGGYPLVVISHGYPGNRFLMSHLAENLATKGFVVAAIDHRDSTYDDPAYLSGNGFGSTLVNRSLDQLCSTRWRACRARRGCSMAWSMPTIPA
ncbi:MAG: hypothetical protein R3D34_14760 [Nitratireductor sp.]